MKVYNLKDNEYVFYLHNSIIRSMSLLLGGVQLHFAPSKSLFRVVPNYISHHLGQVLGWCAEYKFRTTLKYDEGAREGGAK